MKGYYNMREINNNDIFVTDFTNISMTTNLLKLKTPKGEIALDIHKLINNDVGSPNAYFNATQIAKLFCKRYVDVAKDYSTYIKLVQLNLNEFECNRGGGT
jgi:hypothetical protein